MSQIKIEELASDRKALIPIYREKWRNQALSTEPIDTEQATAAVEAVYSSIGLPKPKIHFFTTPIQALEQFDLNHWKSQTVDIETRLAQNLKKQLSNSLWVELQEQLYEILHQELWNPIGRSIYRAFESLSQSYHLLNEEQTAFNYFNPARDSIPTEYLVSNASLFDFCYSV